MENLSKKIKSTSLVLLCLILTLLVRYIGKDFVSGDMKVCLLEWFGYMKSNGGISSLSNQVGDYNLSYQTLIALLTYIDYNPMYLIKISSVFFDYFLAFWVALIVRDFYKDNNPLCDESYIIPIHYVAFFVTLMVPTIVVNSAFWGQCDAMYPSYVLATLYFLRRKSYFASAICLGFAFACKLQTIFILPFLGAYIIKAKEWRVFLYTPLAFVAFWITGIFAYLQGRDMWATIDLYILQSKDYPEMYLNFSSFWGCFGKYTQNYEMFSKPAIVLAIAVCMIGLIYYIKSSRYTDTSSYYAFAAWSVWTVVLLLPSMHERYAFMADALLVVLCFMNYKYIPFAILAVCMSLYCYCLYFFGWDPPHGHPIQSLVYTLAYMGFTIFMFREQKKQIVYE